MTDPSPGGRRPSFAPWLPILALLAPAIVLPLWVPLYNREDPSLLGFPFYYWFQFLLVIVAVVLTVGAYALVKRVDRAERIRHGLPPEAPASRPQGADREREGGVR